MLLDTLADACSAIKNAENVCMKHVIINPRSKVIGTVLRILQTNGYIGEYESIDDGRFGKFKVQLLGRINKIGVIKPRKPIKVRFLEQQEKLYLPAVDFGLLILSTSKGIMSHTDAKKEHIGGRLLAYIF
jgi:small subunit ribosomal protein S8